MKAVKIKFFSILFLALIAVSCSSDSSSDNNPINVNNVTSTVVSGTWRVTLFSEDGLDRTFNFTGYNFTFGSNGTIAVTNGTNSYAGTWLSTNIEPGDDTPSAFVYFVIDFFSPPTFVSLSEDWLVIERTATKIRLRHVSGGDGSTDFLTFEKN